MPRSKRKSGSLGRRTNTNTEPYEINYFASKYNISREQARELIRRIGNDRDKLNAAASKMPFAVTATIDGHIVSIPADTAKEAFAKAIDWQVAKQINHVAISDGSDNYSIAEF